MAHKTFICYKHRDAQDLRDRIIRRLGTQDEFLAQPNKYIEEAYNKSQNLKYYEIRK